MDVLPVASRRRRGWDVDISLVDRGDAAAFDADVEPGARRYGRPNATKAAGATTATVPGSVRRVLLNNATALVELAFDAVWHESYGAPATAWLNFTATGSTLDVAAPRGRRSGVAAVRGGGAAGPIVRAGCLRVPEQDVDALERRRVHGRARGFCCLKNGGGANVPTRPVRQTRSTPAGTCRFLQGTT